MTNNSLTILAPSPINFWTSSEPETLIKVHSVWCATARARSVFPVPGGPYSNTPWKNWIEYIKKATFTLYRTVYLQDVFLNQFPYLKSVLMSSILLLNTLFLIIETLSSSNDNTDFQYKMNTISLLESFEWLDGFTISCSTTPQLLHNICEQHWTPNGNLNNLLSAFRFSDHTSFGDSELLFCRGLLRNA